MGKDTTEFSTQDASGSTSQAAWLQESIEAGATSILIDEDTSATNFMIRDERMQALVNKGDEPITPLVDRISQLKETLGISTMIVMGGSGDYLDHADTVIQMHDYLAVDVTAKAKQVVKLHPSQRIQETNQKLGQFPSRSLSLTTLQKILSDGKFRVSAKGKDALRFGKEFVDISALEQIESASQINTIGWVWFQLAQKPGWTNMPIQEIENLLQDHWYQSMPNYGDLAKPRTLEISATLNRLRKANFQPR